MKNKTKAKTEEYIEPLSIKVTKIGKKYICTLYYKENEQDKMACDSKRDIGYCCRVMLRWFDKCGGKSKWAKSARRRHNNQEKNPGGPVGKIWYKNKLDGEKENNKITNNET